MSYWNRSLKAALMLALGIGIMATGHANARQLSFALGFPPGAIPITAAEGYAKVVEDLSGGGLTIKIYPMSLLNMAETSPGLREGMADFRPILEKWIDLVDGVKSPEALAELYWNEAYSKVDVDTHGL